MAGLCSMPPSPVVVVSVSVFRLTCAHLLVSLPLPKITTHCCNIIPFNLLKCHLLGFC